ncbi:MAG TPA: protein kinase [Acidimicrobiales bacterium]
MIVTRLLPPGGAGASTLASPMALAAEPEIPGFRALSPLGYGPTSTIYSAQSDGLGRWVALTVYSSSLPNERAQRRFSRAFEVARRLGSHPNVVTMLESGLTGDGQPYVATEIYERGTLQSRIDARHHMTVDEVLHMGVQLAGALETAHRADVVHGGIHPARVLLSNEGDPAIADLGLVPLVDRGGLAALVSPMSFHAPPEVLEALPVTPATDVYALASTMYAALAGRAPYQRGDDDTTAALLVRILQEDVPPLNRIDAPKQLEEILRGALRSEPKDRPGRMMAFARQLQTCQKDLGLPVSNPVVLDVASSIRLAGSVSPPLGTPPVVEPAPPSPAPRRVFVPAPEDLPGGGAGAGSPGSPAAPGSPASPGPSPSPVPSEPPAGPGDATQVPGLPYGAVEAPAGRPGPANGNGMAAPDQAHPVLPPFAAPPGPGGPSGSATGPDHGLGLGNGNGHGPQGGIGHDGGLDLSPFPSPAAPGNGNGHGHHADIGHEVGSGNGHGPDLGHPAGVESAWGPVSGPASASTIGSAGPTAAAHAGGAVDAPARPEPAPLSPISWDLPPSKDVASPFAGVQRLDLGADTGTGTGNGADARDDLAGPARMGVATMEPPAPATEAEPSGESAPATSADTGAGTSAGAGTATGAPPSQPLGASRALPVIVLVALVVVLGAGLAWAVTTHDPAERDRAASVDGTTIDEEGIGEDEGDGGDDEITHVDVTAVENPSGVQLDWDGVAEGDEAEGNQVVLVLSETESPRLLPAETGTALLVPGDSLAAPSGYCFAVATTSDPAPAAREIAAQLPEDALSPASCIRGASPTTVRRR